jgi:hypothetical protein
MEDDDWLVAQLVDEGRKCSGMRRGGYMDRVLDVAADVIC